MPIWGYKGMWAIKVDIATGLIIPLKEKRSRKGVKNKPQTKEYWKESKRIYRLKMEKQPKVKKIPIPKFEEDNLRWARDTYHFYMIQGLKPGKENPDYGLYRYGEWITKNLL
jgi:hypothetical protein